MKKSIFSLVVMVSFVFVACNKDEDIVIDSGGINPPSETTKPLDYKVCEYTPAPGQYINDPVIGMNNITSMEEAIEAAETRLSQNLYVSLGSWGGYIVVKFNEPVKNSGDYDFAISSNAFDTSNEPGIVWVMKDSNGNGLPDDQWFELKGSQFGKEGYERNYWVTYYKPQPDGDTPWEDSNGETGSVKWLGSYHSQSYYYPEWILEDSYTLYGSRLEPQTEQNPVTGIWTNPPFSWGYADNAGEDFFSDGLKNNFKISNAVTEDNTPADLSEIDFIKVQSGINGESGWLGELSTEVTGFYRLN